MSVDFYAMWGPERSEEFGESANFSSANGRAMLDLLGYDTAELAGYDTPAEFLAKVRHAQMWVANMDGTDGGIAPESGTGTRGARWVDCGRRPGYFAERLPELEAVAHDAAAHGGQVYWA